MTAISNSINRTLNLLAIAVASVTICSTAIAQQPKKTDSDYVNTLLPEAQRIKREYGIPLDLTIAIARQESGNGDYIIGKGNHFGLRCDSDDCI